MNTIWSKLSQEEKQEIIQKYKNSEFSTEKIILVDIFGEDNLNPKLQINTWEDVVKQTGYDIKDDFVTLPDGSGDDCIWYSRDKTLKTIINKVIATFKIPKLIEVGYGGVITDEEWKDPSKTIYVIVSWNNKLQKADTEAETNDFIAFHTEEQRDKFLQYNEQLCKDYFVI